MAMELANIRQRAIDLKTTLSGIGNMSVNVSTYRMRENLQSLNRETQLAQKNINDAFKVSAQVTGIQGIIDGFRQVRSSITDIVTEMKSFNAEIRQARAGITGIALRSAAASVRSMDNNMMKVNSSIQRNINAQLRHNDSISQGNSRLSEMGEHLLAITSAYLGISALKNMVEQSDNMTQFTGRSQFIVEQNKSLQDFRNQVMQVANETRSQFSDVANFVSKLGINAGSAFKGSDELVNFVKQINQLTLLSGASVSEMKSVMTQLPQALASGNLQGDELRSIRENAPLVNQSIQEYAHQVLGLSGTTKQLGKDGKLTARVIVDAMQWASDKTDEMMAKTPFTFSQRWNLAVNSFTTKMENVYAVLNGIANNPKIQRVFDDIAQAAADTAVSLAMVGGAGLSFAQWLSDIGALTPILRDGALAIGALSGGFLIFKGIMWGVVAPIEGIAGAFIWLKGTAGTAVVAVTSLIEATRGLTAAQVALNIAQWSSPIILIASISAAVIGLIYLLGRLGYASADTGNEVKTSFGKMVTSVVAWGISLYNTIVEAHNKFADFSNDLIAFWAGTMGKFQSLAHDWANDFKGVLNWAIDGINKIAGTHFKGFEITATTSVDAPPEIMSPASAGTDSLGYIQRWDPIDPSKAVAAGKKIDQMFSFEPPPSSPYGEGGFYGNGDDNSVPGDVKAIRKHTRKLADTAEDLSKLRELAEEQVINRYTMLNIDFSGDTNVNGSLIDKDKLKQEMVRAAERHINNQLAQVNEIGME